MHPFGCGFEQARLHCPMALAGKNKPREHPRHSTMRSDFVKALEHALDIGFPRARPSFEKLRLQPRDTPQDHRFDQALAAAEVMQNGGMRDAGGGGDFLQPDGVGTTGEQTALSRLEDCAASLRGISTASICDAISRAFPAAFSTTTGGATAAVLSRSCRHPPCSA